MVFTACWFPKFIFNIVKWAAPWVAQKTGPFHYYFYHAAKLLPVVHVMLNPIIYRQKSTSVTP